MPGSVGEMHPQRSLQMPLGSVQSNSACHDCRHLFAFCNRAAENLNLNISGPRSSTERTRVS